MEEIQYYADFSGVRISPVWGFFSYAGFSLMRISLLCGFFSCADFDPALYDYRPRSGCHVLAVLAANVPRWVMLEGTNTSISYNKQVDIFSGS